jgi:hypothetical protein
LQEFSDQILVGAFSRDKRREIAAEAAPAAVNPGSSEA